jgi:Outer membrane protein beta-barrel domain
MIFPKSISRRAVSLVLGLILLVGAAGAQRGERPLRTPDFTRFSITVGGGAGFAEQHRAMTQLLAELQYSLSTRFRLGLGVGYLATGGHRDNERDNRIMPMAGGPAAMMLSGWGFYSRPAQELGRDFRLVPISLNAYYVVPLARKWEIFLSGGASYYLGTFYADSGRLTKNAWGGQALLGAEFRLTQRIKLMAQGGYRFVEFTGLRENRTIFPLALLADIPVLGNLANDLARALQPKPVDVRLNGFNLAAGIKFGI